MKKSKFVQGRQGGRYTKWLLFESQLFKFDLYILHFEKGAYVNSHIDECIEGYSLRINFPINNSNDEIKD